MMKEHPRDEANTGGNTEVVRRLFIREGFDVFGVAPPEPSEVRATEYREWIRRGFHGSMTYLESHADAKYDPEALLPGCRSVVVAASNYFQHATRRASADRDPHSHGVKEADIPNERQEQTGRVSVYAWGRDYHKVIGSRLRRICRELSERYPDESFRPFVDVLPIAERHYAERAGIGFIGRNTLLITREFGSWVFLSGLLTTLALDPTSSARAARAMRCPSGCTRCIDACPTDALYAPHRIDASKCISYLTIERRSEEAARERVEAGLSGAEDRDRRRLESEREAEARSDDWLFGCDVCQQVCPFNIKPQRTGEHDFLSWIGGPEVPLDTIDRLEDHDDLVSRFGGSPLMRARVGGLKRNARVIRLNSARREDGD